MEMLKTLYLMRHGQTVWNQQRRLQGRRNSPLSPLGRTQALQIGQALQSEKPQSMWCSPAGRARETAEIVGNQLGLTAQIQPEMYEIAFGDWEGFTVEEVDIRWPGGWQRWQADRWNIQPPGGDSYKGSEQRGEKAVACLQNAEIETLLWVGHYAFNRLLIAKWLEWSPEKALGMDVTHDTIYRLNRTQNEWLLQYRRVSDKNGTWQDGYVEFESRR